jgi:hypothetical protein
VRGAKVVAYLESQSGRKKVRFRAAAGPEEQPAAGRKVALGGRLLRPQSLVDLLPGGSMSDTCPPGTVS